MQRDEIVKKLAKEFELSEKQIEDIIDSQNNFTLESMKENLTIRIPMFGKLVPTANIKGYREGTIKSKKKR